MSDCEKNTPGVAPTTFLSQAGSADHCSTVSPIPNSNLCFCKPGLSLPTRTWILQEDTFLQRFLSLLLVGGKQISTLSAAESESRLGSSLTAAVGPSTAPWSNMKQPMQLMKQRKNDLWETRFHINSHTVVGLKKKSQRACRPPASACECFCPPTCARVSFQRQIWNSVMLISCRC